MAEEGKEAGLRSGEPQPGTAPRRNHHDRDGKGDPEADPSGGRAIPDREPDKAPVGPVRGSLSAQTRNRIAAQLRAMYDTVAQQPVPDRFADLIAKLDDGGHKKA